MIPTRIPMKKAHALNPERFRKEFQAIIESFVLERVRHSNVKNPVVKRLVKQSAAFALSPGKRIRPFLAYTASTSSGANVTDAMMLGIALELFHDFALVHDDIIDQSDLRRGKPSMHAYFERLHIAERWRGDERRFGETFGILSGDLLLTWSDLALKRVASDAIHSNIAALWDEMKEEVILGQALDVALGSFRGLPSRQAVMHMLAVKSGRYSIGRPMLLGYALGGEIYDPEKIMSVAEPLGIAFQIQDDLLGVFSDPDATGKSRSADIREGKVTLLAYETIRRLEVSATKKSWDKAYGNPVATERQVAEARRIIDESGAKRYVETLSAQLIELSITRSRGLPDGGAWFRQFALWMQGRTS